MGQEEEEGKERKKKQKHEIHLIDSGDEYMELDNDGSDGCTPFSNANAMVLKPVFPGDSGEGLPYAPENWPNPGDIWKWKVGKRKSTSGFYQDRYLYLPDRLRSAGASKHRPFPSKPPVREYIRKAFPNADVNAFFASFTWRIPWADKIDLHLIKESSKSSGMHPIKLDAIEQPASESTPGVMNCKAGNEICSLQTEAGSYFPALMDCDICCSETGFCRECCCILCGKTIDWEFGGYGFIRCEAKVDEDYICGHVAHVNCALRAYTAGTVGGIIGLDVEYYCRRCDNKTDLISHVKKLLHTCESLDSQDDILKILNLGLCILRGSQKTSAKSLLNHIELVLTKLKSGVHNEEIWKMDDDLAAICKGETSHFENCTAFFERLIAASDRVTMDLTRGSENENDDICGRAQTLGYMTSDYHSVSLKLENEVDQVLQSLKRSQESEYRIAEQKLYAQKDVLLGLYQQFDLERAELSKQTTAPIDGVDSVTLLANFLSRKDQIKQEVVKLGRMMEISKGVGRTPQEILNEHFDIIIDD
ncbi:hypothetical protein AAC387_Pa06g1182 [Persea americana]